MHREFGEKMKIFAVIVLVILSVQAFLPGGLATKATTDGRLTVSSGALGALVMASSSGNLADANRRRRRRRRSGRRRYRISLAPP